MIVASSAILKAGAAYLPLDPDYPAAASALMLRDSATGPDHRRPDPTALEAATSIAA